MFADDLATWLDVVEGQRHEESIPDRFTEFCAWLGVELTPGQSAIAKVAFDGLEPKDLVGVEYEIGQRVFGGVSVVPTIARRVFVAVCGARGGKTYVLIALRSLHRALTGTIPSKLPKGQKPACVIVAPDLKLAGEVMDYIRGAVEEHPVLSEMVDRSVTDELAIRRPDWTVRITCLAASAGGKAGRGRWLLSFAMDEAAFFRDSTYKVNDAAIFNPALSRLPVGGQMLVCSTPYAEAGLLYEKWMENFGKPSSALVCQAPTLTLRDTPDTRHAVETAYNNDPIDADRECGAKFLSIGTSRLFDGRALIDAIERGQKAQFPRGRSRDGVVEVGGDFGFTTNASAIAAVELMPGNRYQCLFLGEETPVQGPLKPSRVVDGFATFMKRIDVDILVADQHHRESIEEHLQDRGLFYRKAPPSSEAFVLASSLVNEGRVDIPDHPKLIRQLREVSKRPLPGGGLKVESPVWRTGEHGDLAAAFVLAIWAAHQHEVPEETPDVKPGTDNWIEMEEEKRIEAMLEKRKRELDPSEYPMDRDNSWILGPG